MKKLVTYIAVAIMAFAMIAATMPFEAFASKAPEAVEAEGDATAVDNVGVNSSACKYCGSKNMEYEYEYKYVNKDSHKVYRVWKCYDCEQKTKVYYKTLNHVLAQGVCKIT